MDSYKSLQPFISTSKTLKAQYGTKENKDFFQTAVSFLHPKLKLAKAVKELDLSSLLIRPTGTSGLGGGGISPGSRWVFLILYKDLLISLSLLDA